ncbi:hypothetical protein J25TS5_23900 [Paenibacillus faecis]|nr:hypothetical protein J25TS5_23900 [Paenibacillus faecis]
MSRHAQTLQRNPLRTKQDLQAALQELTAPLRPHYSEGKARLRLGAAGAGFDASIAEMEGFSRVLWGLVPLLAGGGEDDLWEVVLEGIRHGTDPAHPEYWGEVADYDQRLVEMAAFGFALALIPERIWGPLNERERTHLQEWLGQINRHPCYDCNWLFFNVLVNLGLQKAGLPYDKGQLEGNLDRIDTFYLGDGWYSDGPGAHSDYYVPFAIHFYGLLYAVLMKEEDPKRAAVIRERAGRFAADFLYWFAPDGASLPYGRSLTYRFSHAAFWGAMAYAEMEELPYGVLKGLVLRHFRWWFRQPMLDAEGLLTVGYAYPNLVMAENYNSPGSPYWALKAFLPLALPDDHPFWQAEEMPLPAGPAMSPPLTAGICRRTSIRIPRQNTRSLPIPRRLDSAFPERNGSCPKEPSTRCLRSAKAINCSGSAAGMRKPGSTAICSTPVGCLGGMSRCKLGSSPACPGMSESIA